MWNYENGPIQKHTLRDSEAHSTPTREMYVARVASDKTHCEPSDWVKPNQWVCALAL